MKLLPSLSSLLPLLLLQQSSSATPCPGPDQPPPSHPKCTTPKPPPSLNATTDILNIGVILYRAFDMIDVFGPLEPLQLLAIKSQQLRLHFIASSLSSPITTQPSIMNPHNSSFWPVIQPTHTFNDTSLDLDVLIVPGGVGVRAPNLGPVKDYVKSMFDKVDVLMAVCTGAGLVAETGVMDGYLATTNKSAWKKATKMGGNVKWVSPARYMIDGKVWTSSGVTAALDLTFALIEKYWGAETTQSLANTIEYIPRAWDDDPFAKANDVARTGHQPCRGTM